jgi:hypothetical protein
LAIMVEWEDHKKAKDRILKLFLDANWEAEAEGDLTVSDLDGRPREYRGDVVAVQRNKDGKIKRRVVVEVDTIKPGGGHLTRQAVASDNARTRAIAESYFSREDAGKYITMVKRIPTNWVVGKQKINDETLMLEFGITKLRDWACEHA